MFYKSLIIFLAAVSSLMSVHAASEAEPTERDPQALPQARPLQVGDAALSPEAIKAHHDLLRAQLPAGLAPPLLVRQIAFYRVETSRDAQNNLGQ